MTGDAISQLLNCKIFASCHLYTEKILLNSIFFVIERNSCNFFVEKIQCKSFRNIKSRERERTSICEHVQSPSKYHTGQRKQT